MSPEELLHRKSLVNLPSWGIQSGLEICCRDWLIQQRQSHSCLSPGLKPSTRINLKKKKALFMVILPQSLETRQKNTRRICNHIKSLKNSFPQLMLLGITLYRQRAKEGIRRLPAKRKNSTQPTQMRSYPHTAGFWMNEAQENKRISQFTGTHPSWAWKKPTQFCYPGWFPYKRFGRECTDWSGHCVTFGKFWDVTWVFGLDIMQLKNGSLKE